MFDVSSISKTAFWLRGDLLLAKDGVPITMDAPLGKKVEIDGSWYRIERVVAINDRLHVGVTSLESAAAG